MRLLPFLLLVLILVSAHAQQPRVYLMSANRLAELKKKANQKDRSTLVLIDSLQKKATPLLSMKLLSVMDKAYLPVSGNKHDYMSQAPYFWYDSTKPNGLPYIRRDGEHNPEIKKITDRTYIGDLEKATQILSLAWYFSGKEIYAAKASALIRHWFFNEASRMNPHLEYAQAIPGINTGRGIGIIETRGLAVIADAASLLEGSAAWTVADTKKLQQWYSEYLHWMMSSKNGKEEHAAKNNHGTWFYMQAIDFALFTGDQPTALQLVNESKQLLNNQLTAEGKWPLELERTNALGYSTFNTQAWFQVAQLAEIVGVDLWHYKTSKGAGLQTALDWLLPYALKEKAWPYQQISPYNANEFYTLLQKAAKYYPQSNYLVYYGKIKNTGTDVLATFFN